MKRCAQCMNLKVCTGIVYLLVYQYQYGTISIVQAAKFMHRYRSGRIYRYRSWYRQMLLGGSMQRAARAMHCIALSQIQCPQWECCGPLYAKKEVHSGN